MVPALHHSNLSSLAQVSQRDVAQVLASAQALHHATGLNGAQPLLRGKKLALLSETADSEDAALFRRAASELSAHVAHIRPTVSELSTPQDIQDTTRMLSRLYDGVECQGMPADLVKQMASSASIPIYDGIASKNHWSARLAEYLEDRASAADKHCLMVQVLLLSTLG